MSNPPSRGSGQGGNKTIGKYQLPILNVEEIVEKENNNKNDANEDGGHASERPILVNKQLARTTAAAEGLTHSRSFPTSLASSPNGTPNSQRRQLPPSGIKLPVPPRSLLNGLPNVHKSVSSASLNLHAVTTSAGKSDRLRETVTVPNAGEMMAAARAEMISGGIRSGKGIGPGIGRPSKPAAAMTRLPPLQLPKGPKIDEDGAKKAGEGRGEQAKANDDEGREKKAEHAGPIATMCTGSIPQLKLMDLSKIPSPAILQSTAGQMDKKVANSPPQSVANTPLPPASVSSSPLPPTRAPPLNFVPNEVPIHQHNPRRRPSSAGQIPMALTANKPLPAISEPVAIKKGRRPFSSVKKWHGSRSRGLRLALKCAIISMFLAIPVIIFALIMFFSDGFAPAKGNSTVIPDSDSSTQMDQLFTTTPPSEAVGPTAVNIVGGAIFAPISMQNDTEISKGLK